jgi:D-glycero-D-manno-heptose 1,7-bisphosphate phosphatase
VSRRPALFLDRDGVINVDHAYVCHSQEFEFIDGIFDLCRAAKRLGCRIFVVTNQAGIGRGYYSEQDFHHLTQWMRDVFAAQQAAIDEVYFCPFHPEHGIGDYKRDAECRKPRPGMILQAAREFDVDLAGSVLVGDKVGDVQAGMAAGVGCNLLYTASAPVEPELALPSGLTVVHHLREVAPYLHHANIETLSGRSIEV